MSGTNANMAVIFGLTKPAETITAPDLSGGGHISAARFGALGFRGLDIRNEVRELKSDFSEVKYCYGHHKAYEYISLFK